MSRACCAPTPACRWDVVSPGSSGQGGWSMQVSATRDVEEGEPLVLCYGNRPSDDFFTHYGMVPSLCNPQEVGAKGALGGGERRVEGVCTCQAVGGCLQALKTR